MRKTEQATSWAVYQIAIHGEPGPNVVCTQAEWDTIEKAHPGMHRLVRGNITNECEAERLARGTSGDDPRAARRKAVMELLAAAAAGAVEPDEGPGSLGASGSPKEVRTEAAPTSCPSALKAER